MLKYIVVGARGLRVRFAARSNCTQCCRQLTTAPTFRSCVAQALSHGGGPRHQLHVAAQYSEYSKDFDFFAVNENNPYGFAV